MTKKRKKTRMGKDKLSWYLMMLPTVLYIFVFSYIPMAGIVIAFKNFRYDKGVFGSDWVGFKNFEFFFTSPDAARVIRNTVLYSLDFMIIKYNSKESKALEKYRLKDSNGYSIELNKSLLY